MNLNIYRHMQRQEKIQKKNTDCKTIFPTTKSI